MTREEPGVEVCYIRSVCIHTAVPLDALLAVEFRNGNAPQSEKGNVNPTAPSKGDSQESDSASLRHLPLHVGTRVHDMLTP